MERIGVPFPWGIVPAERIRQVVRVPNPAPGSDFVVTVPGGVVWLVDSVMGLLTNDANVASRLPRLVLSDGNTDFARIEGNLSGGQAAGLAMFWTWMVDGAFHNQSGSSWLAPLPRTVLLANWTVRASTLGIQVGDQWTQVALSVAEYQVRGLDRALRRYLEAEARAGAAG